MIIKATHRGLVQLLATADLHNPGALDLLLWLLDKSPAAAPTIVYSDPPWNPGNEKYWRRMAGAVRSPGYVDFLDAWCRIAAVCIDLGAGAVFCEQSADPKYLAAMFDAVDRMGWPLEFQESWTVYYGSPRRPNTLLHWGHRKLMTDPTGLSGEAMTLRVFAGVQPSPGSLVVDPCMGLGMTSRMAHYFALHCIGLELNPTRLERTVDWLKRQGYEIEELSR